MIQRIIFRLLLLLGCFGYVQLGFSQSDDVVPARRLAARAPVVPFNDTLFYITSNLGSFTAEERATSYEEKIRMASKEFGFHRDSIKVALFHDIAEVVFKDIVIMGVTSADAHAEGKDQITLANEYAEIIGEAISEHKRKTGWRYVLSRIALVVLIIAALYLVIKGINILCRLISDRIEQQKGRLIKSIKFKSYHLMDEERMTAFILSCVRMVRTLIVIIVLYLSIPIILSIFYPTQGIADKLFGYVWNPFQKIFMSVIGYTSNFITIIIIVLVFRYLIRWLRYLSGEIAKGRLRIRGFYPDWAHPTFSIIRTLLYIFMFIVIFPYLPGSDGKIFQGVTVFVGIVVSIASSSVIGNVVSGWVLTYMRSFKVGDRVKIGDVLGNVIEKTPFVVRIRTPKNEEITLSNSNVMSAQTFNYTHSAKNYGLILHTEVSFGYDVPWQQVHDLLIEAAVRTPNVMQEIKPFVLQTSLADFYVVYQINVYIRDADKMAIIYSDLNQNIQDVFNEAGVEIMSPTYSAHRNGNDIVIPPEYLPKNYNASSFNVKVTDTDAD